MEYHWVLHYFYFDGWGNSWKEVITREDDILLRKKEIEELYPRGGSWTTAVDPHDNLGDPWDVY
jgi:hypothetical protein